MFKIENILSYYRCVFTKPDDGYQIMMNKTDGQTNWAVTMKLEKMMDELSIHHMNRIA